MRYTIVLLGMGALLVGGASRRARAQTAPTDTLRAAAAVRIALAANPMLRAARLSADAAAARVPQAGALPDAELELGLINRMASDFGATTDPMTMNQVQLRQMVPWPGKLSAWRGAARHRAAASVADADEQERMLVARVRTAYYDVALADRALEVMATTRRLLHDLLEVSTTMYAVGSGVQQDVLRAQVEVARMDEEITRTAQERLAAAARLNALLGREATSPIGAVELPAAGGPLPATDSLLALAFASRPALRAGAERVAAAEASLRAVRRELLPDFQIGLAYAARPAFDNMASVTFGVSLPLWAGARQLPMRREVAAMRDMAHAELLNLRNETTAQIIELRARAVRDRNLIRLYGAEVLPQARAAVQAALASYRVGRVNFMTLVDNQMTVNRYEIERLRLIADYHQAVGELEALVGRELPPGTREEQP